ncbi:class E sortase [Virgisporangium aliadipatigenens]|uniref:class E sortase n=1 Tax=Virgisporangium aliadipatigenens TaxID=741659 RepID=UPI0019430645|nr:class E sortase [Virgisporangium aliadipatigenens]
MAVLLVLAGLAVGAGSGWQWVGKIRHVLAQQKVLDRALTEQWGPAGAGEGDAAPAPNAARPAPAHRLADRPRREPVTPVPPGTPVARLYLPSLGLDFVVVEGAEKPQLNMGPGRIVSTQPFGSPGNTAIAAHRYPKVFWDLDQLQAGDPVIVETGTSWLVYRAARTVIVEPQDDTVLADPDSSRPTVLTLVTCEPKLSTAQRLVKQAELVRTDPRAGPEPKELAVTVRR